MTSQVQVGALLIEDRPGMARAFGIESEPYGESWGLVSFLNPFEMDRKIHAAGWNCFFMADEVTATLLGTVAASNVRKALLRILAKMGGQNFNCLEVTGITAKRFIGVPYTVVSAHWRHIQQACRLDDYHQRRTEQKKAERLRG